MRQLVYTGPGALEWREVAAPGLDSDHAALVRPRAVATCDLDWLIVNGGSPFEPPFPLGHECVAEVVELGEKVTSLREGQLVVVPFQISCGTCEACRRGRTGNCTTVPFMSTYGFGPAVDRWGGCLSDVVRVPYADHMLVPVPAGLEPTAIASAADNVGDAWRTVGPPLADEPGAPVLILGGAGPGSIGLYAAGLAVALGAESVIYVDPDPARRAVAAGFGAEVLAEIPKRLGPFPITVDSSGDPRGLACALSSTAPDGICTSNSLYLGPDPSVPMGRMYTKGLTFKTSRGHVLGTVPHVLDLAAAGAFDPAAVTTRVVGWDDAADALLDQGWTKLVFEADPSRPADGSLPGPVSGPARP